MSENIGPDRGNPTSSHSRNGQSLTIVGNGYLADPAARADEVSWTRGELDTILRVYGRQVAAGEWRDYAIDSHAHRAIFSVFRRASEMPLYRIEKHPKLARKQGAYQVIAATGAILKRGHDLPQVLQVIDKVKLKLVD